MTGRVFTITVVLAWRKVLAVPDGRGDITGLLVATVAGALGLALLGDWLRRYERRGGDATIRVDDGATMSVMQRVVLLGRGALARVNATTRPRHTGAP